MTGSDPGYHGAVGRTRSQFAALFRTFFARFFENELTTGAGDARYAFFAMVAIFAVPGVIWPILMAGAAATGDPASWGWWMVARARGLDAMRQMALSDKTLYLGYATGLAALLGSINWQSLLPDRRDAIILNAFPVAPAIVVAARLTALLAYLLLFAIGVHTLSAITFGLLLANGNTWTFAVRGIAAHFTASIGVSLAVVLSIAALQGVALAIFGARWFVRWSSALHTAWVAASIAALLVSPTRVGSVFIGVYESIVGGASVAMDGSIALWWLSIAIALVLATYPLVYRRVLAYSLERGDERRRTMRVGARVSGAIAHLVHRDPALRAVAQFYLTLLARGPQQRLAMVLGCGAALAWGLPAWRAYAAGAASMPPAAVFAWPISAIVFVLVAMRAAAMLPSDRAAAWVFDLNPPEPRGIRTTMARTMIAVGVVPIAVLSAIAIWRVWGADIALGHFIVALGLGAMVTELLLWRSTDIPCRHSWPLDAEHLRTWWVAYLISFVWCTMAIPTIESFAVRHLATAAALSAYGFIVAATVRHYAADQRVIDRSSDTNLDVLGTALRAGGRAARIADDDAPVPHRRSGRAVAVGMAGLESYGVTRREERWYDDLSLHPREIWRDTRFAVRRLRRAPGFVLFAVATLGIGIGTTTAAHHLIQKIVGTTSTVRDPASVVFIESRGGRSTLSWPDFEDLERDQTTFASVDGWEPLPASLSARDVTLLAEGQLVTGGLFQTLGVAAMLGRMIQPNDDVVGAPPVTVLSELIWRTKFAGDRTIVGSLVQIGDRIYTVVGIVPPTFTGLRTGARPPGFFVPMAHVPSTDRNYARYRNHASRTSPIITAVGRLHPGVKVAAAEAQLAALGARLDTDAPLGPRTRRFWTTSPIDSDGLRDRTAATGRLILLLPLIIVLVACTNLANLVLTRGASRRGEFVVRRALGASQWSLVRDHLVELGLIAGAGGALAVLVARALIVSVDQLVQRTIGFEPQNLIDPAIGTRTYLFAVGLVVLCVIVAGFLPALSLTAKPAAGANGGEASPSASPRWRGRAHLISGQVAASLALMLIAALTVRALWLTADEQSRVATLDRLAVVTIPFDVRDRDDDRIRARVDDLLTETAGIPGVFSVTAMTGTFDRNSISAALSTPDRPFVTGPERQPYSEVIIATPGVLSTLGVDIVGGRAFDARDARSAEPVIVVNAALARMVFGTTNVVGQSVQMQLSTLFGRESAPMARIIGVAADRRSFRSGEIEHAIYMPLAQRMATTLSIVARTTTDNVDGVVTAMRTAVRQVDPVLAISKAGRGDVIAGAQLVVANFTARVFSALALVTLVMAMSGLYGVLSHVVTQRRRELGIRVALGADRRSILTLVMRDGVRPVAIGIGLGLILAALGRLYLQPTFNRAIEASDSLVAVLIMVPLVAAAAIACYLPARRAANVDPIGALKE